MFTKAVDPREPVFLYNITVGTKQQLNIYGSHESHTFEKSYIGESNNLDQRNDRHFEKINRC